MQVMVSPYLSRHVWQAPFINIPAARLLTINSSLFINKGPDHCYAIYKGAVL